MNRIHASFIQIPESLSLGHNQGLEPCTWGMTPMWPDLYVPFHEPNTTLLSSSNIMLLSISSRPYRNRTYYRMTTYKWELIPEEIREPICFTHWAIKTFHTLSDKDILYLLPYSTGTLSRQTLTYWHLTWELSKHPAKGRTLLDSGSPNVEPPLDAYGWESF